MKCYCCKFVNAAAEARRHPNETTKVTAELLYKRLERWLRDCNPNRVDHLCERHRTPSVKSVDLQRAWKDLQKAEAGLK
jgi:hypothetical protein